MVIYLGYFDYPKVGGVKELWDPWLGPWEQRIEHRADAFPQYAGLELIKP